MISLTARQSELFGFIQSSIADEGIAPRFLQMAKALGTKNKSTVFFHLKALEERGYIRRSRGETRGIDVLAHMADGTPLQFIPHLEPAPSQPHREGVQVGGTRESLSRPSAAVAASVTHAANSSLQALDNASSQFTNRNEFVVPRHAEDL